ncbi:MAG: hypothetical protein BBJ57_02470 [Desulfobacterales bacterium PC51MH44]|nr:MAG: hypothetical protein BBJ57_02470 [Desulfobacterales bacterium PC51MH44]
MEPGEDDIDLDLYPMKEYVVDMKTGKPMLRPAKIAKRRFKIRLASLGNIDMAKVQNEEYIYQPFKKASQLVEKADGLNGRYKLETKDVDCVSTGIGAEEEKVFQWSPLNNLVVDKYTDTYVSP